MLKVPMLTALKILTVLAGALAVPVVAGAIYQAIEAWRDRRRFLPPGRLVRVSLFPTYVRSVRRIAGQVNGTIISSVRPEWTFIYTHVFASSRA